MKIIKLLGNSPYERGKSHGTQLKQEIHAMIAVSSEFKEPFQIDYYRKMGKIMLQTPSVMDPIYQYTPWLLDEVKGIAEGAELDYETMLGFQCLHMETVITNLYDFSNPRKEPQDTQNLPSPNKELSCTMVGEMNPSSSRSILAQNCDQGLQWDGFQTLFYIPEPEHGVEIMTWGYPGFLGIYGLNSKGVGLCYNAISDYLEMKLHGLPIAFLTRGLLTKHSFTEAETFLRKQNFCSGLTCTMGDAQEIGTFEVSPNQFKRYRPTTHPNFVYHTNHPLENSDFNTKAKEILKQSSASSLEFIDTSKYDSKEEVLSFLQSMDQVEDVDTLEFLGKLQNSRARLATVQKYIHNHPATFTKENFMELLSSTSHRIHQISMDPKKNPLYGAINMNTNFSVVMELSTTPVLHVAPGPQARTKYERYSFKDLKNISS